MVLILDYRWSSLLCHEIYFHLLDHRILVVERIIEGFYSILPCDAGISLTDNQPVTRWQFLFIQLICFECLPWPGCWGYDGEQNSTLTGFTVTSSRWELALWTCSRISWETPSDTLKVICCRTAYSSFCQNPSYYIRVGLSNIQCNVFVGFVEADTLISGKLNYVLLLFEFFTANLGELLGK